MKNQITILFLLLFISLQAQQLPVCNHDHCIIDKEVERYLARKNFTANSMTTDYDLVYHRMEWEIDPAVRFIDGVITSHFKPTTDNFGTIHFDMSDELTVEEVIYHGGMLTAEKIGNDVIAIDLPAEINMGQLDSISIKYKGVPPSSGFSAFNADMHNGQPIVWTLSQPYGARDWWPCKQNLNDKIDSIDVYVTVPNGNKVASNGLLKSVTDHGATSTHHWSHRYAIPAYLIAIGVTNYEEFSQYVKTSSGDSILILNYVYPENRARAEADLVFTVPLMELYNDLFGLYPFADEKYGHAEFEFGGGMEHQTMSFMGGYSFELQAHELAHQWFGDKVTCGSWQDIWINEGFATYLTGLGIEFLSDSIFWDGWKRGNIQRVTSQPDGSVYVEDTSSIGSIFNGRLTYTKGGLTLHMVRWILGDDVFFQTCRDILNDPEFAFGYISTEQFRMAIERYSGIAFKEFFDDWIYGEGHPSYEILWEQKNDELSVLIKQTTSHPSVDFFEMPVPLKVFTANGDTTLRMNNEHDGQFYQLDFMEEIDSIQFDPQLWIISRDNIVRKDFVSSTTKSLSAIGQLAPNPIDNICYLQFHDQRIRGTVKVFNLKGDQLIKKQVRSSQVQLSFDDVPSGTYLIDFVDDKNQRFTAKVIKD